MVGARRRRTGSTSSERVLSASFAGTDKPNTTASGKRSRHTGPATLADPPPSRRDPLHRPLAQYGEVGLKGPGRATGPAPHCADSHRGQKPIRSSCLRRPAADGVHELIGREDPMVHAVVTDQVPNRPPGQFRPAPDPLPQQATPNRLARRAPWVPSCYRGRRGCRGDAGGHNAIWAVPGGARAGYRATTDRGQADWSGRAFRHVQTRRTAHGKEFSRRTTADQTSLSRPSTRSSLRYGTRARYGS